MLTYTRNVAMGTTVAGLRDVKIQYSYFYTVGGGGGMY